MTSILTVCTGNICRSPAAELLLANAFGPDAVVTSAGTHAMVGHGIPTPMQVCLGRDGLDGRAHAARQFTATLAREADLIVCMTERHRAWCVRQAPFAIDRTFVLSTLVAAAKAGTPLEGGTSGIASAAQAYTTQQFGFAVTDVPDPYGGSQADYDEAYGIIRAAVDSIAAWAEN